MMPMQHLLAPAVALLLGMLGRAGTASPFPEDCGGAWQHDYKSMHAAIRLQRHAQRFTMVSHDEMGEIRAHGAHSAVAHFFLCSM